MASAQRRGIFLAGGSGTRLAPPTSADSKQLMPVNDKPMVDYPLTTLMLAGIQEVLIITTPTDQPAFERMEGDGSAWGLTIQYAIQPSPDGLAQTFLIGAEFLAEGPAALGLGDNLFHGHGLVPQLQASNRPGAGATVFPYPVSGQQRYGVVEFDAARHQGPTSKKVPEKRERLIATRHNDAVCSSAVNIAKCEASCSSAQGHRNTTRKFKAKAKSWWKSRARTFCMLTDYKSGYEGVIAEIQLSSCHSKTSTQS